MSWIMNLIKIYEERWLSYVVILILRFGSKYYITHRTWIINFDHIVLYFYYHLSLCYKLIRVLFCREFHN